MSMPTGTPSGAVLVGAENPAGTVIAGKPVTDARIPFRSTSAAAEEGERMELTVSEPVPAIARLLATDAAVPPLEPPGGRVRSYGFSVWPPSALTVLPSTPTSCMLVL